MEIEDFQDNLNNKNNSYTDNANNFLNLNIYKNLIISEKKITNFDENDMIQIINKEELVNSNTEGN